MPEIGMLACFAEGAVVMDEGHERCGCSGDPRMDRRVHCAIPGESGRWIDVVEQDGKTTVACLVSGDFPEAPVKLRYSFFLSQAVITRLEIA